MNKLILITFFLGLASKGMYAEEHKPNSFQNDIHATSLDTNVEGNPKIEISTQGSNWKKYISVNLSSITDSMGVFGIGLRRDSEHSGWEIGLSPGMGRDIIIIAGHGSYLRYFNPADQARFYGGIGLQMEWAKFGEYRDEILLARARFSLGRTFFSRVGRIQFMEIVTQWPTVYKFRSHVGLFPSSTSPIYLRVKNEKFGTIFPIELHYGILF